eukprot:EG_transcript_35667
MAEHTSRPRCVIVPGNRCPVVAAKNWYKWAQDQLTAIDGLFSEVVLPDCDGGMPDPYAAREAVWLPYIRDVLKCDADTVLVGHSSGAVAALRLLESGTRVLGCVLVSACYTDLGDPRETEAGYYNRPWDWEAIRRNTKWMVQFHSDNDPYIPLESEARVVARGLGLDGTSDFRHPGR